MYEDDGRLWVFNDSRTMTRGCSSEEWEFTYSPDEDFNLIYYSDILDVKYYSDTFDDGEDQVADDYEEGYCRNREAVQVNMSTSYLIRECEDQMLDYFHKDIRRQLDLYKDREGSELSFSLPSLPKKLSVKMDFMDLKSFDKVLDSPLGTDSLVAEKRFKDVTAKVHIIDLLKEMERYYQQQKFGIRSISETELLQWNILIVYLYNLLSMRQSY